MKLVKFTLAALALLAMACPALAQEAKKADKDYQVYELGEIVVSGQNDAVNKVTDTYSITAEDIADSHALTVPEALSYAPGITVTTGRKNEPEIRIRGFNQEEALILIDGVPYYETNYGKLNLNQLPTEMIARIDIVKGAASVLYGSNAMAGVINIITKKQGIKPSLSATAELGEDGAYRLSASHGNSLGKFKYWFNVNRREADGWYMSDDYSPKVGSTVRKPGGTTKEVIQGEGERLNSGYAQTSVWFKAGVDVAKDSAYYLSAYLLDSRWGMPPSTDSNNVFTSRPAFSQYGTMSKYQDWGLDLSGEQAITSTFKMRGKLFYHNHVDDYVSYYDKSYSEVISTSRYKDYLAGGSLFGDWQIVPQDTLRFSAHYRGDSHKERDDEYLPFAESFSYTGSLGVQNDWKPWDNFVIIAGVSYDWFNVTKAESVETDKSGNYDGTESLDTPSTTDSFNPMVGATYTFVDQTRLFGSVARKTRFPTLQQLFSSKGGNIELDPQHSTNYTLGVSRPFGKMFYGEFSVFYNDIEDRISRDGPYQDSMYRNYSKVRTYGFEVIGELTPLEGLLIRVGYTFMKAKDESDDRVTDDVIGAPENKVDIKIQYIVPKLDTKLDFIGMYLDSQYDQLPTASSPDTEILETSGYFLANFKITQPIWDKFEAFGYVSNILDRDYETESGYPGQGRAFWIGVSAKF
ncbi:MAG: TonB-dependent receptor [Desulfarculus sp.]|nr:TonB-dependent receptor [Pseudomonadota bacterium]MBV1717923.1 TonB-dependent receptor [Desulfarculus sp.]MBU4576952.1 TonB-dependent receptor [Pseudomonadota bacterium]MBU4598089.1 TonB-dependent receptor [Pseudomonadota bacterium]MBV1739873.1 TonB-dependent receptor [Desulfarculus sp.]